MDKATVMNLRVFVSDLKYIVASYEENNLEGIIAKPNFFGRLSNNLLFHSEWIKESRGIKATESKEYNLFLLEELGLYKIIYRTSSSKTISYVNASSPIEALNLFPHACQTPSDWCLSYQIILLSPKTYYTEKAIEILQSKIKK